MKYIKTMACTAIATIALTAKAGDITIEAVRSGEWSGRSVAAYRSTADGKHYTALTDDGRAIVKYQYSNGQPVDTLLDLNRVKPEEGLDVSHLRLSGYELSQDEERLLVWANRDYIYRRSYKADYYYFVIEAGGVRRDTFKRLTQGKVQGTTMAPDGRQLAFMRDGNLFYTRVMSAGIDLAERQITFDGKAGDVINGVPDWVYEEEFAMDRAITWSPDSKTICYLRWDESPVKQYYLPTYMGDFPKHPEYELYPGQYTYKYPVAGEVNSTVTAWAYDVYSKKSTELRVPVEADGYIPRIQFTTTPDKVAVLTLNRLQNKLSLYTVNPQSGVAKLLLEDTNPEYIAEADLDAVQFDASGFTWASERSGYRHLYYYNMLGQQQRQLTKGNFDVTDIYGYDPASKSAYVQVAWLGQGADMPAALTRGIYKVDAKGQMLPLFNGGKDGKGCRGTHRAAFSRGFIYMQHYYSDAETPTRVTLETVSNLKVLKVMEDNKELQQRTASMPKREFFQMTTERGDVLNGYVIRPTAEQISKLANHPQNAQLPCVLEQYSGPGSQEVLDRWEFGFPMYLAQEGFVALTVDGRGTGGRGTQWQHQTYCQLGVCEAEDQISAGRYAAKLPYVDPERIGIWGWSYGGYNTLMTMCAGNDVFHTAVAVAPVSDWKFYDTVYAERYMRTPQQNADGYRAASVLERAGALKGNVLIIHGTADDNVHPQNTYELTERWVQAGLDFDMMIYTNRDHFIRGGNSNYHIYSKVASYFKKNL